jgi:sporulation integral membrane protein YtvI
MANISGDRKLKFIINCVYVALIIVIAYLVFKYLLNWVMPFVIGFIIAAAVQPIARYCHKKHGANIKACSIAAVLILVAIVAVLVALVISKLISELYIASDNIPAVVEKLAQALNRFSLWIAPVLHDVQLRTGLKIDTSLYGISAQLLRISELPQAAAAFLHSAVSSLPSFILNIIIAIIAACFIAADYSHVKEFLKRCIPKRYHETASEIKSFFLTTVFRLMRAYLTIMFITFCELTIGLFLLHVPNPVAIGAVISLVDILPVLGTGTIIIPWAVIELLLGKIYLGAGLLLVYAIITVVRNILEPKIVGSHIGLHPLVTLAAIIIGLKALGVAGMILLPITVILLKHMHDSGIIQLWKD